MGVGNICIKFPTGSTSAIGPGSSFYDAIGSCGNSGDILYTPVDVVNNAVVKAALTLWVRGHPLMTSHSYRAEGCFGLGHFLWLSNGHSLCTMLHK